jgi:hypothetical protein
MRFPVLVLALALGACGGSSSSSKDTSGSSGGPSGGGSGSSGVYLAGSVSMLPSGASLTLGDSNAGDVTITRAGSFSFPNVLTTNYAYSVFIKNTSSGINCSLLNSTGNVTGATNQITVSCSSSITFSNATFGSAKFSQ